MVRPGCLYQSLTFGYARWSSLLALSFPRVMQGAFSIISDALLFVLEYFLAAFQFGTFYILTAKNNLQQEKENNRTDPTYSHLVQNLFY